MPDSPAVPCLDHLQAKLNSGRHQHMALTYGSSLTSKLVKCANTAKQNILQIKHTVKLRDVLDVGNISPGTFAVPENNEFQSHQNGAVMQKMQIQLCFWRIVLVCWSLAASMVWLLKVWCDWASFRISILSKL